MAGVAGETDSDSLKHLVSPLVFMAPWMSTVVICRLCNCDKIQFFHLWALFLPSFWHFEVDWLDRILLNYAMRGHVTFRLSLIYSMQIIKLIKACIVYWNYLLTVCVRDICICYTVTACCNICAESTIFKPQCDCTSNPNCHYYIYRHLSNWNLRGDDTTVCHILSLKELIGTKISASDQDEWEDIVWGTSVLPQLYDWVGWLFWGLTSI